MSDPKQPIFLVCADAEPVAVRINGKANYLNCNHFREFMEKMVRKGKSHFVLDFEHCKGVDSTFLGILAGTAIDLRRLNPAGVLLVCNLNERICKLIRDLGLQALLSIDAELPEKETNETFSELENEAVSDAREVLEAHRNLVEADQSNAAKFQDVIAFLKDQIEPNS